MIQRWFAIRLDALSLIIIVAVVFAGVLLKSSVPVALLSLGLVYALQVGNWNLDIIQGPDCRHSDDKRSQQPGSDFHTSIH